MNHWKKVVLSKNQKQTVKTSPSPIDRHNPQEKNYIITDAHNSTALVKGTGQSSSVNIILNK